MTAEKVYERDQCLSLVVESKEEIVTLWVPTQDVTQSSRLTSEKLKFCPLPACLQIFPTPAALFPLKLHLGEET